MSRTTRLAGARRRRTWTLAATAAALGGLGVAALPSQATFAGSNGAIAFERGCQVWTMTASGKRQKRVASLPRRCANLPNWSPDGRKILYSQRRRSQATGWEIYVMNANGTRKRRLTRNSVPDVSPAFSPNGRRIVFRRGGGQAADLWTMSATGRSPRRLLADPIGSDDDPVWSPKGDKILYQSNKTGAEEVWVVNADGTNPVKLTAGSTGSVDADWSPDGNRIVYNFRGLDGNFDIYVMNADGTGIVRLTSHAAEDIEPGFSPDGKRIVFRSTRAGNSELYSMRADGSGVKRLTRDPATDRTPRWQPR
jgi:Tol biopolymer transport system component